jgi:hypothetical protein
MKIFALAINITVGLFFIFSANYKLFPIEYFEAKIASYGLSGIIVPAIARIVIGFEFLLGLCLLMQITFGKRIQKVTLGLLVFFIGLNAFDYFMYGNDANCGCMGMDISISPLMSILKNLLLVGMVFMSLKLSTIELKSNNEWFNWIFIVMPVTMIFIVKPIYINTNTKMPKKGTSLDFDLMHKHAGFKGKTYKDDLEKGKKIIAFLSLTCSHCKVAGFKLSSYKASDPKLPIFFIINGDSTKLPEFMNAVGGKNISMAHFNGKEVYGEMSGYNLPAVFLVNNGVIEAQYNAESLTKQVVTDWLKKK